MCTMRVVVLKENLGQRETGYTLWDGKQVLEQTAKQIKDLIKSGKKVCGLTLDNDGELVLDKDGFFTTNLMIHRHCGNYRPLHDEGCMANLFYIVIGSHTENEKTVYDCISTRFEQLTLDEADVRAYLRIGMISAGCRIGENDKIEVAPLEFKGATRPVVSGVPKVEEQVKPEVKEVEKKEETVKPEVKEVEKKVETVKPEVKKEDKKVEASKEKTEPKKAEKAIVKTEKVTDKK